MNSIAPADDVEDPKRTTLILDSDLPDASANTGERSTVQRVLAELKQVEFATDVDTNGPRKTADDI